MATPLYPKQVVFFEELLNSQVFSQEAMTGLLVEKGIFTKEEFLKMRKVVDRGGVKWAVSNHYSRRGTRVTSI